MNPNQDAKHLLISSQNIQDLTKKEDFVLLWDLGPSFMNKIKPLIIYIHW